MLLPAFRSAPPVSAPSTAYSKISETNLPLGEFELERSTAFCLEADLLLERLPDDAGSNCQVLVVATIRLATTNRRLLQARGDAVREASGFPGSSEHFEDGGIFVVFEGKLTICGSWAL